MRCGHIAIRKQGIGAGKTLGQQHGAILTSLVLKSVRPVQVQKLTDGFIKDVDSMCEQKEAELQRV